MSYDFEASSFHSMTGASSPVTTYPLSVAIWVKPESYLSGTQYAMHLYASGDSSQGAWVGYNGTSGNPRAEQTNFNTTTATIAEAPGTGAWILYCAVFRSSGDTAVIYYDYHVDSGNKAVGTTSVSSTFFTTPIIKLGDGGGLFHEFDGEIAEFAVWNVALTDQNVTDLGSYYANSGYNSLPTPAGYWPLRTDYNDDIGTNHFTATTATLNSGAGPTLSSGAVTYTPRSMLLGVG